MYTEDSDSLALTTPRPGLLRSFAGSPRTPIIAYIVEVIAWPQSSAVGSPAVSRLRACMQTTLVARVGHALSVLVAIVLLPAPSSRAATVDARLMLATESQPADGEHWASERRHAWGSSSWWAPIECPDHEGLVREIDARIALIQGIASSQIHVDAEVEESSGRRKSWTARLQFRESPDAPPNLERVYRARDCVVLVQALALAVALAVDRRSGAAREVVGRARAGADLQFHVALDGRGEAWVKNSLGAGPGLEFGIRFRRASARIRLGFDASQAVYDQLYPNAGALPRLWLGTLRFCGDVAANSWPVALELCGGLELGALSTKRIDRGEESRSGVLQWSPWAAAEVRALVLVPLNWRRATAHSRGESAGRWSLFVDVAGVFPFIKTPRYIGDPSNEPHVYSTGAAGARAGLGTELRFP